jgi:cysteine desulfurase/selenocysteine lyase
MSIDINKIRKDFPILNKQINGRKLVYFDNAATTQKPKQVIDRIVSYYTEENSNVHRGVHALSQVATEAYENARKSVAHFIHADSEREIIFTRGTTESINLLSTVLEDIVLEGDQILVSAMEHHSNLVPWQQLCKKKNARLGVIPLTARGEIDMQAYKKMLTPETKIVALAHVSNVLGTINPVKEMAAYAHELGVFVVIDGAQATAHTPIDVKDIDCDFYAISAHKAYGPMGIGALYGKEEWLKILKPYHYGGEMVNQVNFKETTFSELPFKFEAGTPNVEGALGMEAALNYLSKIGIDNIQGYEDELLEYASSKMLEIEGACIIGTAKNKTAVLSFVIDGIHSYDLGTLLDQMGIAIRTGHHCAQPLIESLGLSGAMRASFAIYNTKDEVDEFITALKKSVLMLQ